MMPKEYVLAIILVITSTSVLSNVIQPDFTPELLSPVPEDEVSISVDVPLNTPNEMNTMFTRNMGQLGNHDGVFFLQFPDYTVIFYRGYIEYWVGDHNSDGGLTNRCRISFNNASSCIPTGRDGYSHSMNYLLGNDSTNWITGVESYREIVYPELWSGIDLRYFIRNGSLKYELDVRPNADETQIIFQYDGVDNIDISSGDMVIETPFGRILDERPRSYQMIGGLRVDVDSRFVLLDYSTISIDLIGHDPKYPLVIDPSVSFFSYLGGGDSDICEGVTVDSSGNIYVAGYTYSRDFPVSSDAFSNSSSGWTDVFVSKFNPNGTVLEFSTYIGGGGFDNCYDLVVEDDGTVVICGSTSSMDFPVTADAYDDTINGNEDAFLLRLAANGSEIIFSTFIGGSSGSDRGYAVQIDALGDIYVVGMTVNDDFPITIGSYDEDFNGKRDGFLFKMDQNGSDLIFSTFIGGREDDVPSDLCLDASKNIVVVGYTVSDDFPVTTGSYDTTHGGKEDIFVLKMNLTGDRLDYSTFVGRGESDIGTGIVLDEYGCAIIVGQSLSSSFPTTSSALDRHLDGTSDIVVVRLDSNGSSLVYSTFLGGNASEWGDSISIDDTGSIFLTGTTTSDDFPTTMDAFDDSSNGRSDIVVMRLKENGTILDYSSYIGGSDIEVDSVIGVIEANEVVLSGQTYSDDFPVSINAYDSEHRGPRSDLFLIRLDTTRTDAAIPTSPIRVDATPGDRSVNVTWEPPAIDGGLPILGYSVYRGLSDTDLTSVGSTSRVNLTFNDTPLKAGTKYYYAISAWNSIGEGPLGAVVNATPIGQPGAPLDIVATPGCGTILLEWSPPGDRGDLPIEGFIVYRGESQDSLSEIAKVSVLSMEWLDTGLSNGRTYYYGICAYNNRGNGSLSVIVSATPVGPPGIPIQFAGTGDDARVTLSWSWPSDDGGIQEMWFRLYRGIAMDDLDLRADNITSLGYVDGALSNGIVYYYALRAVNSAGAGPFSQIINVTPVGPPGPPLGIVIDVGNRSVRLGWNAPSDDGGSRIKGYIIYRAANDTIFIELARVGPTNEYIDTNVQNGINYTYYVVAETLTGRSPPSEEKRAVPLGEPSEPISVSVTREHDGVMLRWSSPLDWGGATTLEYEVLRGTTILGLAVLVSSIVGRYYVDSNVSFNTVYYYRVRASNVVGTGPSSEMKSIVLLMVPGACNDVMITAGDSFVQLDWSPPSSDGGSPITGYVVFRGVFEDGLVELDRIGSVTSYNDTEVENGMTYYYAVGAQNIIGRGEISQVLNATPRGPPMSPIFVRHKVRDGSVQLSWIQPADGNTVISRYLLIKRDTSIDESQEIPLDGHIIEYIDKDVVPGRTYSYSLFAINEFGTSNESEMISIHIDEEDGGWNLFGLAFLIVIILICSIAILLLYRTSKRSK